MKFNSKENHQGLSLDLKHTGDLWYSASNISLVGLLVLAPLVLWFLSLASYWLMSHRTSCPLIHPAAMMLGSVGLNLWGRRWLAHAHMPGSKLYWVIQTYSGVLVVVVILTSRYAHVVWSLLLKVTYLKQYMSSGASRTSWGCIGSLKPQMRMREGVISILLEMSTLSSYFNFSAYVTATIPWRVFCYCQDPIRKRQF